MGWLGKILGQEKPQRPSATMPTPAPVAAPMRAAPPRTPVTLPPPAAGPWAETESRLHALFAADLARFAADHAHVIFYGFGADCDLDSGEILLCANTPQALREEALKYTEHGSKGEVSEEEDDIRWKLSYWVHYGLDDRQGDECRRYRDLLPRLVWPLSAADREAGLECVCRALLRLELDGSLDQLQRAPDFQLVCIDHSEDDDNAGPRMQRMRKAMR